MARAGEAAIPFDSVLKAFNLAGEDDPFTRDASLARELILLRMTERLSDSVTASELEEETEE